MQRDVVTLSDDAGNIRDGEPVQGTWISQTSAAAAPERTKLARMRVPKIIRKLTAKCDIRIIT